MSLAGVYDLGTMTRKPRNNKRIILHAYLIDFLNLLLADILRHGGHAGLHGRLDRSHGYLSYRVKGAAIDGRGVEKARLASNHHQCDNEVNL